MATLDPMPTAAQDASLPWGTEADGELSRPGLIVASVLGTLAVFLAFPLGVAGIVASCIGLDRVSEGRVADAHTPMIVSWVLLGIGSVLPILGIAVLLVFA